MFTIDFNDHTNLVKDKWYHQIEEDEKEMFGRQKEILNAYGLTRD